MTWFKVDDGFYSSKKVLSIPRAQRLAAVGLWTMAGNWSGRELSDGVVQKYVLDELGATPKLRQALIEARLWLDRGSGDIEFHDWARYQPTRAEIEANREKERIRKAEYRASHGDKGGTPTGTPAGRGAESQGASDHPDPTRPDPTSTTADAVVKTGAKAPRGTRLPEPFIVNGEMRAWAAGEVAAVDVDAATRSFVDYWRGRAGAGATKVDWIATWRNSLRSTAARELGGRASAPRLSAAEKNLAGLAEFAAQERAERESKELTA